MPKTIIKFAKYFYYPIFHVNCEQPTETYPIVINPADKLQNAP